MAEYHYYLYEGLACRVALRDGQEMGAEIYRPGKGFGAGPLMEITMEARSITKEEFDKHVLSGAAKRGNA